MPSESPAQRRLMGMALRAKREGKGNARAKRLADSMSEGQLRDFAKGSKRTKRGGGKRGRRSYRK